MNTITQIRVAIIALAALVTLAEISPAHAVQTHAPVGTDLVTACHAEVEGANHGACLKAQRKALIAKADRTLAQSPCALQTDMVPPAYCDGHYVNP